MAVTDAQATNIEGQDLAGLGRGDIGAVLDYVPGGAGQLSPYPALDQAAVPPRWDVRHLVFQASA